MTGTLLALVLLLAAPGRADDATALLDVPLRDAEGGATTVRAVVGDGPAIVSLWATYCLPCRAEVPALRRAADRWRGERLRVVGVAVDVDDPARARRVASSWGIDYPTYALPESAVERAAALAPRGLPVTFAVGPRGVERHDGVADDASLAAMATGYLGLRAAPEAGD